MFKVLFTGSSLAKESIAHLAQQGIDITTAKIDLTEEELIVALKGMDGYICGGDEKTSHKVLDSTDTLKIWAFLGTGYQSFIDAAYAKTRGVLVTNTPGINAPTVAEFTVALILSSLKNIVSLNNSSRKGRWDKYGLWNIEGKTVGIIGMGAIGSRVARILRKGFNVNILYYNRTAKPEVDSELQAKSVDLDTLLINSDIVSLHSAYARELVGMIGERELKLMKPSAILVNTARPELVDAKALYKALKKNKLARAAFDGYYSEPAPKKKDDPHKLLTLPDDKFILTPHTAFKSTDAVIAMEEMLIRQVTAVANGQQPEHVVN